MDTCARRSLSPWASDGWGTRCLIVEPLLPNRGGCLVANSSRISPVRSVERSLTAMTSNSTTTSLAPRCCVAAFPCATISPLDPGGSAIVPMQPSEFGESSERTQEILRESEERFRLLVEGVKDYAIFMLDVEGRVTTWNLGAQRIKGYESEEIIGEHFSIFYTREDVERGYPEEVLCLAAADGRYEEEGLRVRKDGSQFWADVVITALRDEAGDLRGFAKVTRDMTARKEAEERERLFLREQAARERATDILESISDAFYAVDEGWRFTYVNGKAEELWGRYREELLDKNIWEEFPQEVGSESYRQIKRAMEEGVTTEFETISQVLGTWVAGRAYPSREGLSVYFQDVTERKRAERDQAERGTLPELRRAVHRGHLALRAREGCP